MGELQSEPQHYTSCALRDTSRGDEDEEDGDNGEWIDEHRNRGCHR